MFKIVCEKCGETIYEEKHNSICSKCLKAEATQKKLTHLKGLQALTLSKRLALVEEYIYEDKLRYK